ncbi:MAG: Asp-tRNA(Asn)/Glu-tRNA(Gln) amidotransferase subunit GatB, partial [Clostridiales bacterium]|nr:Asp-tRNA(Asn)/Glu-tRNA(Gln) amidotransferase subunit GatB [Clostridiales bacterium]
MDITSLQQPPAMCIGLEVHVALHTKTKLFCACPVVFSAPPNSQCCPICLGFPGTLPALNQKALFLGATAGFLTKCKVHSISQMARKHYYYPDSPKGYQRTQAQYPLCTQGAIDIPGEGNKLKTVPITRIHIEEDAGKSIHQGGKTFLDYNRCGVPLIEIVSAPVLSSAQEAVSYLKSLRQLLIYGNVTKGKMNEGDFRCDVNISLQSSSGKSLTPRMEVKNLNSFQSVQDAIGYEYQRLFSYLEKNESLLPQTRGFNQKTKRTFLLRNKEQEEDYQIITDPNFYPVFLPDDLLKEISSSLPLAPWQRESNYMSVYALTPYQAKQLSNEKEIGDYFDKATTFPTHPPTLANMIITDAFKLLPPQSSTIPISPEYFALLAQLVHEEKINSSIGKKLVALLWEKNQDPYTYIETHCLWQINDEEILLQAIHQVFCENPALLADYKRGKTAVSKSLIGK